MYESLGKAVGIVGTSVQIERKWKDNIILHKENTSVGPKLQGKQ